MALHKYSEIIDLPVVCAAGGNKVGVVRDIVYSPHRREVISFLLEHRGLEIRKKIVKLSDVLSIGNDALIISNMSSVRGFESHQKKDAGKVVKENKQKKDSNKVAKEAKQKSFTTEDLKEVPLKDEGSLLGLHVFAKNGTEMGKVTDITFDSASGRIESILVSEGFFEDVYKGRRIIPLVGRVELGNDFAVVEKEAVEEMEYTGGGIKNKLFDAKYDERS